MRFLVCVLGVLLAGLGSAEASKRVTPEQLATMVAEAQTAHKSDAALVRELADVELTARVTEAAAKQMMAAAPGQKSAEALEALVDESVFLEPEAGEVAAAAAPDFATQKQILGKTVHYVVKTMPGLPNFLAERRTTHFNDALQVVEKGSWPERAGLHRTGESSSGVTFRDGRETDEPWSQPAAVPAVTAATGAAPADTKAAMPVAINNGGVAAKPSVAPASEGMTSWGEFGPILGIVLVDAAKGKLGWARWEMRGGKQVAVFQFAVAKENSHYVVQYCCTRGGEVVNGSYGEGGRGRGQGQGPTSGLAKEEGARVVRQVAGYHGQLTVDPETGEILRITLMLDLKQEDPIQKGAMMVDYGPVAVGDVTCQCPVRAVTVSTLTPGFDSLGVNPVKEVPVLQLNEVSFGNYKRFGSEATLITDVGPEGASPADGAVPAGAGAAAGNAGTAMAQAGDPVQSPVAGQAAVAPVAVKPAEDEEVAVRAVEDVTWMKDQGKDEKAGTFTLRVTSRTVEVPLLAFDKHNKPVTDLKPEDVEVYDNGRKQTVQSFRHKVEGPVMAEVVAAGSEAAEPGTFTNATVTKQVTVSAPDMLILLLDEGHLAFNDIHRAKDEVLKYLKAARPNARIALYSISEQGIRIIQDVTIDHAAVELKLNRWQPTAQAIFKSQELDKRNRQEIDTVRSPSDLASVNGNNVQTPDTISVMDPQLRQMGDNPLRRSMEVMTSLARHFASVPGHKSLAWITGDSAVADWEDRQVGMEKGDKYFQDAMNHTREALNEAQIALYVVDATEVYGGGIGADLQNRNVQLSQAAADTAMLAPGSSAGKDMTAGRVTSAMQDDLRGIQGPVRTLAEQTGGAAIRKGGELAKTLETIEQEEDGLYDLGFAPDTQADGKYHALTVKVAGRKDLKLRYRSGYLYAETSPSNKERFQDAVWSPQELTGIGLTAEAVPAAESVGDATLKLRIAFKDVELKQDAGSAAPRWSDDLYVFVAQRNDAVQKAQVSGDTLRLRLKDGTYQTGMPAGIPFERTLRVNSKLGSVRVIVVDGNSGRMGTVTVPAAALVP